jgi:hypothetical protein
MGGQLGGDLRGGLRRDALGLVYRRQFVQLRGRHLPQLSPFPGEQRLLAVSLTRHRHIFAGAPSTPRRPPQARRPSGEYWGHAPWWPATDTIPSFAPQHRRPKPVKPTGQPFAVGFDGVARIAVSSRVARAAR